MSTAGSSPLALAWARIRDSLWLLPALAVVVGVVLPTVAVLIPTPQPGSRLARLRLFSGGAEGARGVLSVIAASLITVTGTVFSVTILALQLVSSQFTPRVLGSFVADRVNEAVLGVFIGTFTYPLPVLRTIHSAAQDRVAFVPHVGVTLAMLLLLLSIGQLIVFIGHAAQSMRASVVIRRETTRTRARIDERFPTHVGTSAKERPEARPAVQPEGTPARVVATEAGYLQSLHAGALWRLDVRTGGNGRVVLLAHSTSYERAPGIAFDQVRHYGTSNPIVAFRLIGAFGKLAMVAPHECLDALQEQGMTAHTAARRRIEDPFELAQVEHAERSTWSTIEIRASERGSP